MGNQMSIRKVNFEDIQNVLNGNNNNYGGQYILINTLDNTPEAQNCILPKTIHYSEEERVINKFLEKDKNILIIVYGKNANDASAYKKYTQLVELGFHNVFLYPGGLFEWLLLQDIYSDENFPTTKKELDILKYKSKSGMNIALQDGSHF